MIPLRRRAAGHTPRTKHHTKMYYSCSSSFDSINSPDTLAGKQKIVTFDLNYSSVLELSPNTSIIRATVLKNRPVLVPSTFIDTGLDFPTSEFPNSEFTNELSSFKFKNHDANYRGFPEGMFNLRRSTCTPRRVERLSSSSSSLWTSGCVLRVLIYAWYNGNGFSSYFCMQ